MRYLFGFVGALALGLALMAGCSDENGEVDAIEWASTAGVRAERQPGHHGFGIVLSSSASSEIEWLTDGDLDDYKPVYSPDGSKIAFFRVFDYGDGNVPSFKTKICVMDADGSNVRELTDGDAADFNPYWARDGSDQINFTRFTLPFSERVYRTSADAEPGDEQLISDPEFFEFSYSNLEDGRILVRRDIPVSYFLMTPNPEGTPTYEQLSYPRGDTYLHKMTISPSETKVAYMRVEGITLADILAQRVYRGAVIAYADLDPVNLRIENEVVVSEYDESLWSYYPAWTPDERFVIWGEGLPCPEITNPDCTPLGVIKAYSLDTGVTSQISSHDELEYRYPTVLGTVK